MTDVRLDKMVNRKKTLQPLSTLSMTDRVENSLRQYLEENAFKPGDSLPNEMEIAEKLHVSRNVVREALSRLRMLGMVEARPRRGMVIAQPDILGGIEKVLNPFILGRETLKDIFEMRLMLELGLSDFLFVRKDEQALEELEAIVKKQKNKKTLSKEEEIEFHGKLYEMTGNETLKRFQILLLPVFEHVMKEYYQTIYKNPPEHSHVTHEDLFFILKDGTPEKFRKAMKLHLSAYLTPHLKNK